MGAGEGDARQRARLAVVRRRALGMGPAADELFDVVRAAGGVTNPVLRQRLADLHIEAELLRLIRLRTVTARIKGEPPGAEASIRKILADEHGQRMMRLAKDLAGAGGMLTTEGPLGADPAMWHYGDRKSTRLNSSH